MRVAIFRAGGHFHFGAETRRRAHHRCSYCTSSSYWYVAQRRSDRAINSAERAAHGVLQACRLGEQFNTRAAPAVHSTSGYSAARCATALRDTWRASVEQASLTRARAGAPSRKPPRRRRHVTRPSPQALSAPRPPPCPKSLPRGAGVHAKNAAPSRRHNAGLGRRPLRQKKTRDHLRGRRQVLLPS